MVWVPHLDSFLVPLVLTIPHLDVFLVPIVVIVPHNDSLLVSRNQDTASWNNDTGWSYITNKHQNKGDIQPDELDTELPAYPDVEKTVIRDKTVEQIDCDWSINTYRGHCCRHGSIERRDTVTVNTTLKLDCTQTVSNGHFTHSNKIWRDITMLFFSLI